MTGDPSTPPAPPEESPSTLLAKGVPARHDSAEEASRVLRAALRRAPLPSVAGLAFEIMGLAWVFGAFTGLALLAAPIAWEQTVSGALGTILAVPTLKETSIALAIAAPIVLLSVRLASGLAAIASQGIGQGGGATLPHAWKLGARTQISALGIWIQIYGMMLMATLVLLGPLVLLWNAAGDALGPIGVAVSGLALAFVLVYGAGLGAIQELGLASLVRHERGVGSAVLHAWRLIRNRRATSGRMALVEVASRVALVAAAMWLGQHVGWPFGIMLLVVFGAFAGGVRCHAWSLAYLRIGGLDQRETTAEA